MIDYLGSIDSSSAIQQVEGVSVSSVQRAGVFETTTIRGKSPEAVLEWLDRNGYQKPQSAEAIQQYIDRGWVFAASKATVSEGGYRSIAALHPLAFTFRAPAPVYPTRLTAVAGGDTSIVLYVLGVRRATARGFRTERCDRLALDASARKPIPRSAIRISDPEVMALAGNSTVGTKLVARLTPGQMATDVEVGTGFFWSKGRLVYSHSGARTIALNVAVPMGVLGWLLAGMSRGGWKVGIKSISCWRQRSLAAAVVIGLALFLLLPKVQVEAVRGPVFQTYGSAD